MPRFKFHIFNDVHTVDHVGQELPDADAARVCALGAAREIMAHDMMAQRRIDLKHWIEVEDESGEMTVVQFGDAIRIENCA